MSVENFLAGAEQGHYQILTGQYSNGYEPSEDRGFLEFPEDRPYFQEWDAFWGARAAQEKKRLASLKRQDPKKRHGYDRVEKIKGSRYSVAPWGREFNDIPSENQWSRCRLNDKFEGACEDFKKGFYQKHVLYTHWTEGARTMRAELDVKSPSVPSVVVPLAKQNDDDDMPVYSYDFLQSQSNVVEDEVLFADNVQIVKAMNLEEIVQLREEQTGQVPQFSQNSSQGSTRGAEMAKHFAQFDAINFIQAKRAENEKKILKKRKHITINENKNQTFTVERWINQPILFDLEWKRDNLTRYLGLNFKEVKNKLVAEFGETFVTKYKAQISQYLRDKKYKGSQDNQFIIEKNLQKKADQQTIPSKPEFKLLQKKVKYQRKRLNNLEKTMENNFNAVKNVVVEDVGTLWDQQDLLQAKVERLEEQNQHLQKMVDQLMGMLQNVTQKTK